MSDAGRYSIHRKDAVPERIDDGNTTGVESPNAIAAAGRKPDRAKRTTDRVIEIEDDSEVLRAIAARIRAELRIELDDLQQRVKYLEHQRDNGGRR